MTLFDRLRPTVLWAALLVFAIVVPVSGLADSLATPVAAQDASAPARPTGLSAVPSHNSVTLSCDDPGDASITHYEVFRRDRDVHASGEFISITANTGSAETTYTDDRAQPLRRYRYRVKAVNQHGASQWSRFAGAETPEVSVDESQRDAEPVTKTEDSADADPGACPDRNTEPTPVPIAVDVAPIVVASTTDNYFVLYVNHAADGTEVELPVLVKKGPRARPPLTNTWSRWRSSATGWRSTSSPTRPMSTATASTTSPSCTTMGT